MDEVSFLVMTMMDSNPSNRNAPVERCLPTARRRQHHNFLPRKKMQIESYIVHQKRTPPERVVFFWFV
jgi:hypothetical protein